VKHFAHAVLAVAIHVVTWGLIVLPALYLIRHAWRG